MTSFSGPGGRTEADFNAHIAVLATGGALPWGVGASRAAGSYRTTAAAAAGGMFDSVWLRSIDSEFAPCRLVQHGVQSQAIFNELVANGQQIFFRLADGVVKIVFTAVSRNGYTSLAFNDGSPYPTRVCNLLIRWDRTMNKAMQSNPFTGSAETEYTW